LLSSPSATHFGGGAGDRGGHRQGLGQRLVRGECTAQPPRAARWLRCRSARPTLSRVARSGLDPLGLLQHAKKGLLPESEVVGPLGNSTLEVVAKRAELLHQLGTRPRSGPAWSFGSATPASGLGHVLFDERNLAADHLNREPQDGPRQLGVEIGARPRQIPAGRSADRDHGSRALVDRRVIAPSCKLMSESAPT